jgi:hypothetical protein
MTSEEDFQKAIERAEDMWGRSDRDPENEIWWGFYAYGDASPAIGGGVGAFIWFPERDEMLDFIKLVLPYSPPGPSQVDWGKVERKTSAIVDQMRNGNIDDESATNQLNEALKSFSQFEWMGTFDDLRRGQHPYAIKVREGFRSEHSNSTEPFDRIGDGELAEFKEFIGMWGM